MSQLSAKNKIFVLIALWVLLCGSMFGYFFNILDNSSSGNVLKITEAKKELLSLQAEQKSYRKAQADLDAVKNKLYPPQSLFSQDISLVNQVRTLEGIGEKYGVKFNLSGLSGTVKTATKAKTSTEIYVIPISFNVVGQFRNVVNFVEVLENLDFPISIYSFTTSVASKGEISVSLGANFYIRK